jgi:hypothetical protein
MEAPPMLWLWSLRDMTVIFFGAVFSLLLAVTLFSMIPLVPVALYAILTITFPNGFTILSYIKVLFRFLISAQQVYFWR